MSKRGKIVLGKKEVDRLKCGDSLIVRLQPGTDEVEIKASQLVQWNKHSEGSVESILEVLRR